MYNRWRRSAVTKRLFEELELAVIDSFQDYIPEKTIDETAMLVTHRQGNMQAIELVLDWSPAGVEGPNDEDS